MLNLIPTIQAAHRAGTEAGEALVPRPMTVRNEGTGQEWHISEGVCGFAWVKVRPGKDRKLGNALKRAGFGKCYGGGLDYWVSYGGQSYERKMAYARAFAAKMNEADLGAEFWAGGRLD